VEDFRYSIYHDDVDGMRQITRHLIELGHKKIAYLGNSASGRTTVDWLTALPGDEICRSVRYGGLHL
jgi:DNA-binding LacI/PurR family transcriptional regulator